MATDLAPDPEYQLFVSLKCYEAAYELLISDALKDHAPDQVAQVLKRLGNIRNEIGVYYMNQAAAMQTEKEGTNTLDFPLVFLYINLNLLVSLTHPPFHSFCDISGVHSRAGVVEKEFCHL